MPRITSIEVSVSITSTGDTDGEIEYAERIPLVIDPGADHSTVISDMVVAIGMFRRELLKGHRPAAVVYHDPKEYG